MISSFKGCLKCHFLSRYAGEWNSLLSYWLTMQRSRLLRSVIGTSWRCLPHPKWVLMQAFMVNAMLRNCKQHIESIPFVRRAIFWDNSGIDYVPSPHPWYNHQKPLSVAHKLSCTSEDRIYPEPPGWRKPVDRWAVLGETHTQWEDHNAMRYPLSMKGLWRWQTNHNLFLERGAIWIYSKISLTKYQDTTIVSLHLGKLPKRWDAYVEASLMGTDPAAILMAPWCRENQITFSNKLRSRRVAQQIIVPVQSSERQRLLKCSH